MNVYIVGDCVVFVCTFGINSVMESCKNNWITIPTIKKQIRLLHVVYTDLLHPNRGGAEAIKAKTQVIAQQAIA